MELDRVEPETLRSLGRASERLHELRQLVRCERAWGELAVGMGHGRRRDALPAALLGGELRASVPGPLARRLAAGVTELDHEGDG